MKILTLGLDNSILDENSPLAKRTEKYSDLTDQYTVIVPAPDNSVAKISEKVMIYGVKSKNKIVGFFRIYKLGRRLIKEREFDIITAQDQYFLGLMAWYLARKFKLGLEIQVHGFERYSGFRKFIAKFIIPRTNSVRTVSQRLKKQLMDEFSIKEGKITVAPIYIEQKNYQPTVRGTVDNKFVFVSVGRLVPVKNVGLQIEAIKKIVKKHPDTELWIVGDGPERKGLEEKANNNKAIKFFGEQKDVNKFYNGADVFLLTSDNEGWGMVVIEAASKKLPIIMTDVGCAGEVIKHGESGIVVPVGDLIALVGAMNKLIIDRELGGRLGEGAKKAVLSLPSQEEILNLYKESWSRASRK